MLECHVLDVFNPDGDGKNHAWIVCPVKKLGIYSREGRVHAIAEMKKQLNEDFVITKKGA